MRLKIAVVAATIVTATGVNAAPWTNPCWEQAQQEVATRLGPTAKAAEGRCDQLKAAAAFLSALRERGAACRMPADGLRKMDSTIATGKELAADACR